MQLSDFEYDLPSRLIAQYPVAERTASRLLRVSDDGCEHHTFAAITDFLRAGDLLVVNNTRVIRARLFAVKDSGGEAELLVERILDNCEALCQVRVSKPLKAGRRLTVDGIELRCMGRQGQFYRMQCALPFAQLLEQHGHVPLPPYIRRPADADIDDERYQTVFGRVPGAVAAPTAGLHFSRELLQKLQDRGVGYAEVTLHVGAGTFQPVRTADIEAHQMHREHYLIDEVVARQIDNTRSRGSRIVAVGTTVARTLESASLTGDGTIYPGPGETRLFIKPGFQFQVVDTLVTNFHLPGSTLLMLVCAFAGYQRIMAAYQAAVTEEYRFFSYGDAMWLERGGV